MNPTFTENLKLFQGKDGLRALKDGLHGIEKESLRSKMNGHLTLSEHPKSLSEPMTDPKITTDFSESQLELITSPHKTPEGTLAELFDLHKKTWQALQKQEELIWPSSMPCILPEEDLIPIARYGDSKEAQEKEIYRKGLGIRYGKTMQMLSGVHYNFSLSEAFWDILHKAHAPKEKRQEFINKMYLGMLRNFVQHRWFLVYLFGASPTAHDSYSCPLIKGNKEYAIALRMSRCGYANSAKIQVNYNDFNAYLKDIEKATKTSYEPYEKIGLFKGEEQIQLNTNLLQIANEYYFPLRLKPASRENGLMEGLMKGGAAYAEVRIFDLNPFEPTGVSLEQMKFTHLFLLLCLLSPSPFLSEEDLAKSMDLQQEIALKGRKANIDVKGIGKCILDALDPLASLFGYEETLNSAREKIHEPSKLLAMQILQEMDENEEDFIEFNVRKAKEHSQKFSQ